jgi:proliferating cell nuclear antigen
MFEITLKDAKTVRGIFEAVAAIVGECKMSFKKDGISMNSIDDGRICLINLKLNQKDFDEYKCEADYDLGLNIEDMVKILKRSSNDSITFKYQPDTKKIKIVMKNDKSKKSRQFSLGLIDLGDSGIKPEALEGIKYNASVLIPISYLDEAIKDADIFSETMSISLTKKDGIMFKAEGQIGESETVLEKGDENVENFKVDEDGDGTFALSYLKNIIKVSATVVDKVELSLNSNTPVKVKFNVLADSNFTYYLAPRIEEEEENSEDNM